MKDVDGIELPTSRLTLDGQNDDSLDLPEHLLPADRLLRTLASVPEVDPPQDLCDRTMHRIRSGEVARRIDGESAIAALTSLRPKL